MLGATEALMASPDPTTADPLVRRGAERALATLYLTSIGVGEAADVPCCA